MTVGYRSIGKELAEIIGLPKRTRWFELRCAVGEAVTVRCEVLLDEIDNGKVKTALQNYELIPRKERRKTC